jgi:hypothetical protein
MADVTVPTAEQHSAEPGVPAPGPVDPPTAGAPANAGPVPARSSVFSWTPTPPQAPATVDAAVIATLVTGLAGLFPVSLILGGVWLRRHGRKPGRRPRKLVHAGMTVSVIWALAAVFVVTGILRGPMADYEDPGSLAVGQCFTAGDSAAGPAGTVPVQACDQSHDAEVYALAEMDGVSLTPTADEAAAVARAKCLPQLSRYVVDPWGLPEGTELGYYYDDSIFAAVRSMVCYVHLPAPVSHSVRMGSDTLTADQYRFVASIRQVFDLRAQADESAGTPWEVRRDAAAQVATALAQEDQLFTASDWPAAARPALAQLAAAQEKVVSAWRKAGDVPGEQDFAALEAQAEQLMPDQLQGAVRAALGLRSGQAQTTV